MISEHLSAVVWEENRLFVQASPEIMARGLRAILGPSSFALTPMAEMPAFSKALKVTSEESDAVNIRLNTLEEWMVPGLNTFQIEIKDQLLPCTFVIGEVLLPPLELPEIEFKALAAAHRAIATLHLDTLSETGEVIARISVPLEAGRMGGTTRDGYQNISQRLPLTEESRRILVSVDYLESTNTKSPYNPFIFLADPTIAAGGSTTRTRRVLFQGQDLTDSSWYEAVVPLVRRGETLDLAAGDQRMVVLRAPATEVWLTRNEGHSICLSAPKPADVMIIVNGQHAGKLAVQSHDTWMHLPSWALTGEPARLEIRDADGLCILSETWFLPPRSLTPVEVLQRESSRPWPTQMFTQSAQRFEALRAHLQAGSPPEVLAQLPMTLEALEAGYDKLELRPLALPEVAEPEVSVIIPAHNKVKVTYACLCALLLAWNRTSFEVILVDDASTDETAEIEALVSGIRVVRNAEPQRFIRACNAGAAVARGRFVALLC